MLRLPLLPPGAATEERPETAAARRPAAVSGRRILVVDDNRDAAESLAAWLDMIGNTVQVAYDGAQALTAAESFGPEVVVLDIGMPGMSGHEVARRLRQRIIESPVL